MLARALVPTFVREDPGVAIALTGSAARGDASAGSDLDLWCISSRHKAHHRTHGTFQGVDVTLLCDGPRSARAERSFIRCEVADLVVLHDPNGIFPKLKALFRKQSARIWKTLGRNTSEDLIAELTQAGLGPAWNRLPPLRESAVRFASAWVYRRFGWRTPRWRTLSQVLPARAAHELERVLGLPPPAEARRALEQLRRVLRGLGLGPLPDEVRARMKHGEWAEAVLLARRHVEREVVPGLRGAKARRWAKVPPALARVVQRLHGVGNFDDLRVVALRVAALGRSLDVLRWFSSKVAARLRALGA